LKLDPWLSPFQDALKRRYAKTHEWINKINDTEGGLDKFSKVSPLWCQDRVSSYADSHVSLQGAEIFGIRMKEDNSIVYREWAPNAIKASLIGDFSAF
jgi:1,4-alpha-glucan branching enzyme